MEPDAAYSTPSGRQPTWRAPELAENAPVRYPARRLPLYGEKPGGRQAQSATHARDEDDFSFDVIAHLV